MRQRAHLLRVDDLLVLATFLRTLSTFVRVDLLPTGEVDRLDSTGGQQTVDGFRIAVSGHPRKDFPAFPFTARQWITSSV